MHADQPRHLESTYLRLRPDATVEPLPVDDTFWQRLTSGALGTFRNEYLVSAYAFREDWTSWERHPNGDEIVCLLQGDVTFVFEEPQGERTVRMNTSGSFLLVPRGVWHTAKVQAPSNVLFITAGEGTEHRSM